MEGSSAFISGFFILSKSSLILKLVAGSLSDSGASKEAFLANSIFFRKLAAIQMPICSSASFRSPFSGLTSIPENRTAREVKLSVVWETGIALASSSLLYNARKCGSRYEYEKQKLVLRKRWRSLLGAEESDMRERYSGFMRWDCLRG